MGTELMDYGGRRDGRHLAHWFCGISVSVALFVGVVLSGRPSEDIPPRELVNVIEAVVLPPPPQKEVEPPPEAEPVTLPMQIDFHSVPSKESIAVLEVMIVPKIEKNQLDKIDFDLASLKASLSDVKADTIYSKSDVDDPPEPVYQPFPKVPSKLKKKGKQYVRVMFYVDEKGRVANPYIIETTNSALNEFVLGTLVKWKYRPAKKGKVPVRCWVRTSIIFSDSNDSPFSL